MKRDTAMFKRVASYFFEEVARFRPIDYESSGSEHSSDSSLINLSDLVNSFMERDFYAGNGIKDGDNVVEEDKEAEKGDFSELDKSSSPNPKRMDELQSLLGQNQNDVNKNIILEETKKALMVVGDSCTLGFKRSLMTHLRKKGLDAGLCKSKWEKSDQVLAGNYEYIDVNVNGNRYIVEVNLAGQYEIARPSSRYAALIKILPSIYVGNQEDLKQIVKLMCTAIKKSMKSNDLLLAPWRRNCYMQLKWFGPYRRTINAVSDKKILKNVEVSNKKRMVIGFEASSSSISYYCRDHFAKKNGAEKVGYLAAEFSERNV